MGDGGWRRRKRRAYAQREPRIGRPPAGRGCAVIGKAEGKGCLLSIFQGTRRRKIEDDMDKTIEGEEMEERWEGGKKGRMEDLMNEE